MALVAYEQRRIRTIRSTWIILAVTLVLVGATAALLGALSNIDPETGEAVGKATLTDVLAALNNPLALVPLSVLAAMAFGGEYRFGLIRQTLTTFPRRTQVLMAKLWVTSLWLVAFLLLAAALTVGVAFLFRSNVEFDVLAMESVTFTLRSIAFGVVYCLYAFALVLITRNQSLSIIILVLWTLVVESLLVALLGSRVSWLEQAMPIASGTAFVAGRDMLVNAAVFVGVFLVLLLIGWALFKRRDA